MTASSSTICQPRKRSADAGKCYFFLTVARRVSIVSIMVLLGLFLHAPTDRCLFFQFYAALSAHLCKYDIDRFDNRYASICFTMHNYAVLSFLQPRNNKCMPFC